MSSTDQTALIEESIGNSIAIIEKAGYSSPSQHLHTACTNRDSDVPKTLAPPNTLVHQLRKKIRQVETASRLDDGGSIVTHGCTAIDRLLPEKGYARGTLVQWLTTGGHGTDLLSLMVAQKACEEGGALVVIDPRNEFFPQAAATIGVNLDNLIVLRTHASETLTTESISKTDKPIASYNDLLWAVDQSLRCPAVAAVWGYLPEIDERWFRRFQLSAESSGCLGLFTQPCQAAQRPSWADVQWLVGVSRKPMRLSDTSSNEDRNSQSVRLQLTRCRGTHTGKTLHVTIDSVTGKVQLARNAISRPANSIRVPPIANRTGLPSRTAYRKTNRRTG